MKNTSCAVSLQQSESNEVNAMAPLRVGGLAQTILEHAEDPAVVRATAREILGLVPDLLAMLVSTAEGMEQL